MITTYQEFVDDVLEGYHEAGIVDDIARDLINGTFCDECGTKMRYEGWLNDDGSSYRALAICTNPACQNCFEF